jgi:hypothetical protein
LGLWVSSVSDAALIVIMIPSTFAGGLPSSDDHPALRSIRSNLREAAEALG